MIVDLPNNGLTNRAVHVLSCLAVILVITGCTTPAQRSHYLQEIEPLNQTNLVVYRSGTNLDIRVPLHRRAVFAHASWAPTDDGASDYEHRFAVLNFEGEKRSTRKSIRTKGNLLRVYDFKQWQQLLGEVFAELAPAKANHAVLLLLPNQEMAVFHDPAGKLSVVKLENKPGDVEVDGTCNGLDFARKAVQLLRASAGPKDAGPQQFFFVTGKDPAFVFLDAREHLIVFLDYAAEADTEQVPVWFAARAVNSLVIRSMVVSAIKNPLTLAFRALWQLGGSGAAMIHLMPKTPGGPPPPLAALAPMDMAAWEKDLDEIVPARRYKGRLDLLIDGDKFFPAFIQSVANATKTVDVLVYIFDTDNYAVNMADLLKKRSSAIKVRVLFDDMGSLFAAQNAPDSPMPPDFQRPASILSYLKDGSRVEVRAPANPWLTVDHRKCIIVDGREAYVGGMNIGRNYRYDWHDMMVHVRGPVVGKLEKDYRLAWAHAGPLGDLAYAWAWLFDQAGSRKNTITNAIDLRPLRTSTGITEILRAQFEAIERSRNYIYIETPYFDDERCLRALIRARRRGVDVRVIFPARNDSGVMQLCNALFATTLLRNGIRVYAYPGMTHVKAAIYDGWACVGSANFDKMSLRVGQELDIAFSDPETVGQLKSELFEKDFTRSHEITQPGETSWLDSFVKAFTDQL